MVFICVEKQRCLGRTRLYVYTVVGGSRFLRGVDPLPQAYTASHIRIQRSQKLPFFNKLDRFMESVYLLN